MVVKITYISRYKTEEYEHVITIESGVDYAYFKALFDALIELHVNFKIEPLVKVGLS